MGIDVTTLNIDLSKLNIDNNNNNDTQPDDADKDPKSTACTLYLTKYAKTKKNRVKYDAGNDEERIAKTTERYFPSQICDMRQEQGFAPQKQPSDAGGRTSGQYSRHI